MIPSNEASPPTLQCDRKSVEEAWQRTWDWLEEQRDNAPNWTGELSTSALSTATAVSALYQAQRAHDANSDDADSA
ncbi:MAG: hypothetical protein AAGG44_14270, partial [Planctomycetota bacterium]